MADPSQHLKRQRLATTTAAAAEPTPAVSAAAEPAPQQTAPGPAAAQQQQQQSGDEPLAKQQPKRKVVVMPTPVVPPTVPVDPAAWENAVLLVDKPQGWTSFDVCGKLRPALAGLLGKKNRDTKVGHAGERSAQQSAVEGDVEPRPAQGAGVQCGVEPLSRASLLTASLAPHSLAPPTPAGTLDPMATGLLIVCVGRGTKAVDAFMAMTKKCAGSSCCCCLCLLVELASCVCCPHRSWSMRAPKPRLLHRSLSACLPPCRRYTGTLRLGEGTPSLDAETPVETSLPWEHITGERERPGLALG